MSVISREHLKTILPSLYAETKEHPELVKEVDFGGLKEKIDAGLPLRKATFQTLGALLETAPEKLDLQVFTDHVGQGFWDQEDVMITSYNTFRKLAEDHSTALLEVFFLASDFRTLSCFD